MMNIQMFLIGDILSLKNNLYEIKITLNNVGF